MTRPVIRECFIVILSIGFAPGDLSVFAQTPPPPQGIQNQPAPSSSLVPQDTSGSGNVGSSGAVAVTPAAGSGAKSSSSLGKSFGSAGNGLPGMRGGPAVNGTLGAQDPSGQYMRPPVIPPVLCDPAIDIPC